MCQYVNEIQAAVNAHYKATTAFTALQVRDDVRAVVGPSVDVRYLDVKHECLSYFEKTSPKGWRAVPVEVKVPNRVVASSDNMNIDKEVTTTHRVWTFAPPKWRPRKTK